MGITICAKESYETEIKEDKSAEKFAKFLVWTKRKESF